MIFFINPQVFIQRIILMAEIQYKEFMEGPNKPPFPVELNQFCAGYLIGYLQAIAESEDE